ncbi:hypothetical protein C2G38_2028848 [Gigaspora rosea]|uniref:TLDc domain-containing protein n=1 Tax=Gigaspora rosea TaxID=44941 RepID=A0A397W1J1_9GLOM|nr:hypothetical protein C2G38_2028848 [Gigaspora rosea]
MLEKSGDETVLKNILEIVNEQDAQQESKPTDNPPEIYLNDQLLKQVEHNENLLKSEHFELISEWVYEVSRTVLRKFLTKLKFKVSNPSYNFKLLFKESEDGFTPTDFHKKCDNKGPTLTVLKVKGEDEILGGYNPYNWDSPAEQKEIPTKKSFIFKFNLNNPENFVFSRAKRYRKAAIKLSSHHGPNFKDLRMTNDSQDGSRWRYSHKFYDKKIRDSESDTFSVDDYEVFQVELKS